MPSTPTTPKASWGAQPPKKVELCLLEEDDEFEEFPADDCPSKVNEPVAKAAKWEDNWDDDNVDLDFTDQLRNEYEQDAMTANRIDKVRPPPIPVLKA